MFRDQQLSQIKDEATFWLHFHLRPLRDREDINALAKAGVEHVTIWLQQSESSNAVAELEELARQLLP